MHFIIGADSMPAQVTPITMTTTKLECIMESVTNKEAWTIDS